jgi:hypothetical protein
VNVVHSCGGLGVELVAMCCHVLDGAEMTDNLALGLIGAGVHLRLAVLAMHRDEHGLP